MEKREYVEGWPHVAFENPFFHKLGDVFFRLSTTNDEPVLVASLSKNQVILPFPGIKRELQLGEMDPDSAMLELLSDGLKFVKGLRIGDPIPREVLTGEASWSLSERHYKIAYQRIALQLVNWMTKGGEQVMDADQILKLAEDPIVKKKINDAFGEAAEQLGVGRNQKELVIGYVNELAQELAYIEALRERFQRILGMMEKVQGLRRLYGSQRQVAEIADQVARLGMRAVHDFGEKFLEIDAQTGEIIAALKNLENQVNYIRGMRDDLYIRLSAWSDVLRDWSGVIVRASSEKPELLRQTYQFLAPRYMQVDEWVLMTKPLPGGGTALSQVGGGPPKPKGKAMCW